MVFTIFLSLDRFIAIRKPFFYAKLNDKHTTFSVVLFVAVNFAFGVWYFLERTSANVFALVFVLVGSVFMAVSNTLLYRSVKRQCFNIASTIVHRSSEIQNNELNDLKRRQLKSLTICALIAATFLSTYLPLVLFTYLRLVFRVGTNTAIYTNMALGAFSYSNGIWDVLIFLHLNRCAKRRLRMLWFFLLCSKKVSHRGDES